MDCCFDLDKVVLAWVMDNNRIALHCGLIAGYWGTVKGLMGDEGVLGTERHIPYICSKLIKHGK